MPRNLSVVNLPAKQSRLAFEQNMVVPATWNDGPDRFDSSNASQTGRFKELCQLSSSFGLTQSSEVSKLDVDMAMRSIKVRFGLLLCQTKLTKYSLSLPHPRRITMWKPGQIFLDVSKKKA